jgi:hypothetical protein
MDFILGGDHVGAQAGPIFQDGGRRFIAGGFYA